MPICPRCGKCLSSEQALTYHLNRKYRCGIWNCEKCKENFNTKFQMQIHEMSCIGDRKATPDYPTNDLLLAVYESVPVMIVEYDPHDDDVLRVSPQCETLFGITSKQIIGKKWNQLKEKYQWKNTVSMRPNLICVMS